MEYTLSPPYTLVAGQNNEPAVAWSFTDSEMYSSGLGSAVRMENGIALIGEGRDGTLWDVTPTGSVEWKYKTNYNTIWRAYVFYAADTRLTALGL